jgi:hypothetical protein
MSRNKEINELARIFYAAHGYRVADGYRFDEASHPQEKLMFNLAQIAYDFFRRNEDAVK